MALGRDLEALVRPDQLLEGRGQVDALLENKLFKWIRANYIMNTIHLSDVLLQSPDPVVAYHKPELQGAEPLAQGDLPVLKRAFSNFVFRQIYEISKKISLQNIFQLLP